MTTSRSKPAARAPAKLATPDPGSAKTVRERSTAKAPHEVRIIGGQWKRSKLPVADKAGLRPTPDRVRETLFNWLGQDLGGWRCLDVFAGTGALGFEAASRGAGSVALYETEPQLVEQLRATQMRLAATQVKVERADGVMALKRANAGSADLIFIDPPFDANLFDPALAAAAAVVAADGFIYLEAPRQWPAEALAALGLQLHRHLKAGAVHAHLLTRLA